MDDRARSNAEPRHPYREGRPARPSGNRDPRGQGHQLQLERQNRTSPGSGMGFAERKDENLWQLWRHQRRHEAAIGPDLVWSAGMGSMLISPWSRWDGQWLPAH